MLAWKSGAKEDSISHKAPHNADRAAIEGDSDGGVFWHTFRHGITQVDGGVRIHYVTGGEGDAVVLLHGFPQTWREWRFVMPALVEAGHTVIAADLRGFGDSDRPLEGYDTVTVSEDIRQVAAQLGHKQVSIVGHDLGASVAYSWAASHQDEVKRLVMMDALPAGLESPSAPAPLWHHGFLQTPDLPEIMVSGNERAFLSYFFRLSLDPTTFTDENIDEYVRTLSSPGGIRGVASHLRMRPKSAALNRNLSEKKLAMPVLAIGASATFGTSVGEGLQEFALDVTGVVAEDSGHWIPEEQPAWLAGQLTRFLEN